MKRNFFKECIPAIFAIGLFLFSATACHARIMMAQPDLYVYETSEKIMTGAVFGIFQPDIAGGDVKLIAVKSPVCKTVEIHSMIDDNGIMRMRKIDAMPMDNAGRIVLEPTGYHIMLIKLSVPLKEGVQVPLTFVFSNGTEKTVDVPVIKRGARK